MTTKTGDAHTEAAFYAEGTPYTADELYMIWFNQASNPDADTPQRVYELELRSHPDFTEDWLRTH